ATRTGDSDLRELIEPALARWNHEPARAVWLERLNDPGAAPRGLILAIRCLGSVREQRAGTRLRELAVSERAPRSLRLEAARALVRLRVEGLVPDAKRLAAQTRSSDRLVAATLLRHQGKEPVAVLQQLAADREPAVAALAVARLVEIDPTLGAAV